MRPAVKPAFNGLTGVEKGEIRYISTFRRIYLTVAFVAFLIILAISYSFYTANRMSGINAPLRHAAVHIGLEATHGHLWLEEIISGDVSKDIAVVWKRLDDSEWHARGMLEGGQIPEGRLVAVTDPQLRKDLTGVLEKLKEFRAIAEQRYAAYTAGAAAGSGTELDQRLDLLFANLLRQADQVENDIVQKINNDRKTFKATQIILVAGCIVSAIFVGFILCRFERQKTQSYLALQEVAEDMERTNVRLAEQIAERKKAEREAQNLAKFPSENPNPVLRIATDGKVLYINNAAKMLLQSWKTAIGKPAPQQWQEAIRGVLESGKSVLKEETIDQRIFSFMVTPVIESGYANLYGRDITERKQAEQQLQQYQDDLEKMVDRRTKELTAVNKELEAFAYSVSHDLRTPLRAIDGFSMALLEEYTDKLDDAGKDYLGRVRAASQRMGRLIDDLLKLSLLTRSEMEYQDVDLSALARGIADGLKQSNPARQVEFIITDGLTTSGDATLLQVLMENLLDNAWKFTAEHERARIEFGSEQQDHQRVYYIRDDGAGFDMTYVNKLFGAFQRLHSQTEFSGTGIGLATVQRIVNRHGGRVWAQGEVQKGAVFYFTL